MTKPSPYTYVRATYQGPTVNAFWFDVKDVHGSPRRVSIPRSLIHGADERHLAQQVPGSAVSFRLMPWKAREMGL